MEMSIEDGTKLIKFARENLTQYLTTGKTMEIPPDLRKRFGEKGGAFVTLNKMAGSDTDLRGCIGIILPMYPLIETVQQMSIASAVEDPRFPAVKNEELSKILIEISVLSVPKRLEVKDPKEYFDKIKIGRDGLIISRGGRKGLLLPQVPIEHGRAWSVEEFLEHTCQKAWLPAEAWKDVKSTIVESFSATIFEEESPGGAVIQKEIGQ
jgi:hypothetical protein